MKRQSTADFDAFLARLRDTAVSLAKVGLERLSDLPADEAQEFRRMWPQIDDSRRKKIASSLVELAEENFELDFTAAFYVAIDDPNAEVRQQAIEGLWESMTYDTADLLVNVLRKDPAPEVRAAAASSLGRFTYLIELGKTDKKTASRVREALLAAHRSDSETVEVRRRALEALGYLCDQEVADMVAEAYQSDNEKMRASAIFAMGRNCHPRWLDTILREMDSPSPEMRFEAARAAGELEDQRAVPQLERLVLDPDGEVRHAAIAALGEIGGRRAKRILRACLQSPDASIREAAEEALEEINFFEEPLHLPVD
ncbi:MAG: HEAT repeat domain-containing protein [Chloroflexota bacterium]